MQAATHLIISTTSLLSSLSSWKWHHMHWH